MRFKQFLKTIFKQKSNIMSFDKAGRERFRACESRFSNRLKKARLVAIFAVGLIFILQFLLPFLMPAGTAEARDTSSNAVIYGGTFSIGELQQKLSQGAGPNPAGGVYAPHQDPANLQLLFHTLGIWEDQFPHLQDGTVHKNGNVYIGGQLVGTGAISAGRVDLGGTVDITYMDGYNLYWRPPTVSFRPNSISALVYTNGSVVYAIVKDCGNPIRANPVGPPAPRSELVIEKLERNVTKGQTNWVKETQASPEDIIEYQINYATSGPNNNVIVYDALGEPVNHMNRRYIEYVSGGTYYATGYTTPDGYSAPRMAVFPLGNLPSGTQGNVNFTVRVKSDTPPSTTVCNSAAIRSDQVAPIVSNNVCLVTPAAIRNFSIEKTVRRADETTYHELIDERPSEYAYYKIKVKNTGNANLTNLVVKDNLPPHQTYVSGSTKLYNTNHPNGITINDNLVHGGVNVGSYAPGAACYLIFKIRVNDDFVRGTTTMTNQAGAMADHLGTKWDQARVRVSYTPAEITESKAAINVTQGGVDAQTVTARPGDIIRYTLTTRNIGGETERAYVVRDDISDIQLYSNVTNTGGGTVQGGEIVYPARDIAAGVVIQDRFEVIIKPDSEWPSGGSFTMTNVYGNTIVVPVGVIIQHKTAFNETQGVDATTTKSKPGDIIRYTLSTTNLSSRSENNYIVHDDISDIQRYAAIKDTNSGTVVNGVISWAPVTIAANQTINRIFTVTIRPDSEWPSGGSFTMTNVYGDTVVVPVVPPTPPSPGVLPASTGAVKGLATTGTILNVLFGTFITIASIYLYFRQRILLKLALLQM